MIMSMRAALAAALLSLLLGDFAATRAGVGASPVDAVNDEIAVAGFQALRDDAAGNVRDSFGNVLDDISTAAHGSKRPFAREFKMMRWLDNEKCVDTRSQDSTLESARSCSKKSDRLWFGWSDETTDFLNSVILSPHIAPNFPLMVSLNRKGWALLNANAFKLPYPSLGYAVDPMHEHPGLKTFAKHFVEGPSSKDILQFSAAAERYLERLHVEFADWTGVKRAPIGGRIDDETRAELVASILQSPKVRALTISWAPQPTQKIRENVETLDAVAVALAHPQCGIQYLAIYDQHVPGHAVAPMASKGLLSALSASRSKLQKYSDSSKHQKWSKLREFSVSLRSFGLVHDGIEDRIAKDLVELISGMQNLRHLNMRLYATGRPINPATLKIESKLGSETSLSVSTANAFVGVTSSKELQRGDKHGRALLVAVPWNNGLVSDPLESQHDRSDLEVVDRSLLDATTALTLFVKRSALKHDEQVLGADIARMPSLKSLAIDGWWSFADVNHVLLQMQPMLPSSVRNLLIRPVSLQFGRSVHDTMAVLHGMLVNSRVEELALTVILPCGALDKRLGPQLVDALVGMRYLAKLDLVLYTCATPEATNAAGTVANSVQAGLRFAAHITHLTYETKSWTENSCRSDQRFPPVDAFSSALSEKLKNAARCTPPDNRFPMPHHFSDAFTYRAYGSHGKSLAVPVDSSV